MRRNILLWTGGVTAVSGAIVPSPLTSRNPVSVLASRLSNPDIFACAATSWPPTMVGGPNVAQEPSEELASILSEVNPANIEATILKLVSFGTRHTLSIQNSTTRGIGAARDWIASEFQKYANASDGRLTVEVVGYEQQPDGDRISFPVRISDVVATLKGTETPERLYVVSGHYDSRVTDPMNYWDDAPGGTSFGVEISL